ncbi:hypothetical protein NADFUDRAFT_46341 [Nadsonia fulvescens var. elongata DSM 6958]|uniref:Uncharacterized protein n=1 Tax=Nadsonia fulvescens var. elongata DSM 6958 TaxID=857566 RepID=A0A1E3PJT3_9ASCO|nr:hypothetical protein NADFUDRAFT_46341 [Nadsonia fulvescens var. elongata DSM 6958]
MDSLSSLSSNLPSNRISPTEYARMDNELSTEFKSAAMAVTQLYKLAGARAQAARDKGYLEAINDIIGILNDGNIDPLKWAWDMRREYSGDDESNAGHPDTDITNIDPASGRFNRMNFSNNPSGIDHDGDMPVDSPSYPSTARAYSSTPAGPSVTNSSSDADRLNMSRPATPSVGSTPAVRPVLVSSTSTASSTLASTTTPVSRITFSSKFTPVSTPASTLASTLVSTITPVPLTAPCPLKPAGRQRSNISHPGIPLSSGAFTMESSVRYPTMGAMSGGSSDTDYDNDYDRASMTESSKRKVFWKKSELAKKAKFAAEKREAERDKEF